MAARVVKPEKWCVPLLMAGIFLVVAPLQMTVICEGFSSRTTAVAGFSSYHWNTNATPSVITITDPGEYWLEVMNDKGCRGQDTIMIALKPGCLKGFYMPTGFTPNNDGKNDVLKPYIGGIVKQYKLTIYNRWGQVVFETSDYTKGWDGKFNGMLQDGNVFTWICAYQLEGEKPQLGKGTFVLIR